MSLRMQLRRIVFMMIIEYAVPSLALNCPLKSTKSFMKVFTVICLHARETNAHARVNLCEMSTYVSCWSWSVSQFSTYMTLLRHGCQRNSFWNSQTDSQMYTFPDQMNWQFVQILMDSKFHSKLRVLDTDDVKQKTSLFSVEGKSAWYCFKAVVLLFYIVCVRYTK